MSIMATIARFVSIMVVSCVLITVGTWVYHNRNDLSGGLQDFRAKGGFSPATWMLWVSGHEWEDFKVSPQKGSTMPEFKPAFEPVDLDPGWLENYNKSITWSPDGR
jgi:hypothetical protein